MEAKLQQQDIVIATVVLMQYVDTPCSNRCSKPFRWSDSLSQPVR